MKNNKTKQVVLTGLFLAMLVAVQFVTKPMGQFVTGSLVNFILISSALAGGMISGLVVALVSPFLAFAFGIGPAFVQLIPMIAVGNAVIVVIYSLIFKGVSAGERNIPKWATAIVVGAVVKFGTLYMLIVKFVLPSLLSSGILNEKQVMVMGASFSTPQLITALIGGVLAFLVMPTVIKASKK